MYDIKYQIRFINTEDNHIFTEEALLGFIKGLIAGNHDIKPFTSTARIASQKRRRRNAGFLCGT